MKLFPNSRPISVAHFIPKYFVVFSSADRHRETENQTTMAPPCRTFAAAVTAMSLVGLLSYIILTKRPDTSKSTKGKKAKHRSGVLAAIGNTPLIRINSLSEATGCEVCRFLTQFLFLFRRKSFFFWFCGGSADSWKSRVLEPRREC